MGIVISVPGAVPLVAELLEIGKTVVARWQLEFRQMIFAKGKFQIAHVRDLCRVLQCTVVRLKQRSHLSLVPQIKIPGLIAHPVFILQRLTGLDTEQHIVGLGVLLAEIVGIIGADQGKPRLLVHPEQRLVYQGLVPDAMVLHLQVEVLRAKNTGQLQRVAFGIFVLSIPQLPGNLPRQACRQRDQPPAVLSQQLQVDAGLDVKPLRPGHGNQV